MVLYSNMIRSGNTVKNLSKALKKGGARNVYCYGFHAHCTNDQLVNIIDQYPIKELIMTNSIQHSVEVHYMVYLEQKNTYCISGQVPS